MFAMTSERGLDGFARRTALMAATILALVACAGDTAETTTTAAATTTELAAETTSTSQTTTTSEAMTTTTIAPEAATVRVTTLSVCSEAHLAWGIDRGTFADRGVEIELVQTAGGAAGLAAIISESADLSSTNPASAILAVSQGFPVQIVTGSFSANPDGEGFAEGVVVRADSDIQGPEDLADRRVAVNELGSQNHFFTQAWIREAGVDPIEVNMLALPFPELVPAVMEGRVDAALMTGSMVAGTVGSGSGRLIGNPLTDVIGPVPIATYIATSDFLASSPDLVAGFAAGLTEAIEAVNDPINREDVLTVMSDYCGAPVEALGGVRFPAWEASVDPAALESIVEVLVQEGALGEPVDVASVLADVDS